MAYNEHDFKHRYSCYLRHRFTSFYEGEIFFLPFFIQQKKISLKMGDVDRPASPLVNNKPGVTFFCTPVKKKTFHFDMDL